MNKMAECRSGIKPYNCHLNLPKTQIHGRSIRFSSLLTFFYIIRIIYIMLNRL